MSDFGFYMQLGWDHIMSTEALDHILFLLALAIIYPVHHWKRLLILVTAFTIGHTITLALSTLDSLSFPTRWIEFLIPLTIVLTAIGNVFYNNNSRNGALASYLLALFFGLIHGLGFANTLRFLLVEGQSAGWSLFGFNLGLEAGQIVFVSIILFFTVLVSRFLKLHHRKLVLFVSGTVFILACKMAIERFPN